MDRSIIRISKELSDLQKVPDLSIAVSCKDADVRNVRGLIVGPHETPYEFGFFEFNLKFGADYPSKAPSVIALTTNGGRCRFNPNIYSTGKVCLSILGTWPGRPGEQWSSAQGMESVLLSIQSLMSATPYENEPGYEHSRDDPSQKQQNNSYVQKIRHETIRISVVMRLEHYLSLPPMKECSPDNERKHDPVRLKHHSSVQILDGEEVIGGGPIDEDDPLFEPFKDLCKRRFLWYFETYLRTVRQGREEVKDGHTFKKMPFESPKHNSMDGTYHYEELEKRLIRIKKTLDAETAGWSTEGLISLGNQSTVAVNIQHQFEQVTAITRRKYPHHIDQGEGKNPFVWIITYFGPTYTDLDGGVFRIRVDLSPRFPQEQPRVKFLTTIFHHCVANDGTVCYVPNPMKKDDLQVHIETIFAVLEEDDPAYDPRRIVNPEASQLYWSREGDGKKQYRRKLRRSVQDSVEEFPE